MALKQNQIIDKRHERFHGICDPMQFQADTTTDLHSLFAGVPTKISFWGPYFREGTRWPAMRRSPAAEHLAAPPVARQQLRAARNALKTCSSIPACDHVGIATVAPLWSLREATCEASRPKKHA